MVLSNSEVLELLDQKSIDWLLEEGKITKQLKFKNFDLAFDFMTHVARICKLANHHPFWTNEYSRVSITFVTHDANGVTMKDIDLAEQIDALLMAKKSWVAGY
ncbi:MAG: 4a-hydroxytetrahydrobiopterin dehydratase [Crocinitomicaceae bacterium]